MSELFGLSANVFISREITLFSCGPLVRGMPQSVQNIVKCSVWEAPGRSTRGILRPLRHYVLLCFLRFFVVERQRPKNGKIVKTSKHVVSERFGLSANVLISKEITLFSCGPLVRGMPKNDQNVVNCSVWAIVPDGCDTPIGVVTRNPGCPGGGRGRVKLFYSRQLDSTTPTRPPEW